MPPAGKIDMKTADDEKRAKGSVFKTISRLWRYLSRYRVRIILVIVFTILSNWLALFAPMLSGRAIDAIQPGPGAVRFGMVFRYCAWIIVFYLISSVMNYFLSVQMVTLSQDAARKMREDVFEKLLELPVSFFDNHQVGEIISHISYDIDTVNTSLSNDMLQICASAVAVVGSMFMMLSISPVLGLVFVVTIPLGAIFIRYKAKQIHSYFRVRSIKLGELNGFVEEITTGQKTIKAYHQEESILRRFDERNEEAVSAYYDADYESSVLGPFVNLINNLSLSIISVFGAVLYLFERLTIGDMSSFILYSRKFSGPINEAANVISEIQSAAAAADRVFNLLDQPSETPDAPQAPEIGDVNGNVEMSRVRFGYTSGNPVLHNLCLRAKPGEITAIVGETGAGKTTIINLLMRFYDPWRGKITINGQDIAAVTKKSLRRSFAMVLQESWLFHGTVYENIAYGSDTATRDAVIAAARAAQAHDFIMCLPDGYDTIMSDDGVNISKGQKQLLTIARAMLLDVNMLILDEATSNVDTRTEIRVQEAMRRLTENKTCFIIAHRLSTVQNADNILVMSGGDVVEQGTHENLLRLQGAYASLYRSQFGYPDF